MKTIRLFQLALLLAGAVTTTQAAAPQEIRFGFSPGPYKDFVEQAVKPGLEAKGYKVSVVQFQDYVQPNLGLANKETDVNVFQHLLYLEKFSKDRNLQLSPVVNVPTAGLGIYSNKIKSLNDLKKGDEVTAKPGRFHHPPTRPQEMSSALSSSAKLTPNRTPDMVAIPQQHIKPIGINKI